MVQMQTTPREKEESACKSNRRGENSGKYTCLFVFAARKLFFKKFQQQKQPKNGHLLSNKMLKNV